MIKCPICGKYLFQKENDFDICPICNWENDGIQYDNPDETDCANEMSLNEYKAAWEAGKPCR